MHVEGWVIGSVVDIERGDGRNPDILVLVDRSRAEYPNLIACDFWTKQQPMLEGVARGELVKVVGSIKSRKSPKGQWFTHFSAFQLTRLGHLQGSEQHRSEHWPERDPDRTPRPHPVNWQDKAEERAVAKDRAREPGEDTEEGELF